MYYRSQLEMSGIHLFPLFTLSPTWWATGTLPLSWSIWIHPSHPWWCWFSCSVRTDSWDPKDCSPPGSYVHGISLYSTATKQQCWLLAIPGPLPVYSKTASLFPFPNPWTSSNLRPISGTLSFGNMFTCLSSEAFQTQTWTLHIPQILRRCHRCK